MLCVVNVFVKHMHYLNDTPLITHFNIISPRADIIGQY